MGFLNPWLLVGTAAVAVPILIHLLNRFRRRRVRWAAMEWLRRAVVMRSRRVRLEDLLLLAMRCLAVLLIALAMARPTFTCTGARWFGGEVHVGAVIAVDGSYSMDYRPAAVRSRFDHAMATVREIGRTLSAGDRLSVVLMGEEPRILLRNVVFDEQTLADLVEAEHVRPLPERLNLELALEQTAALVAEMKTPIRECYIVTDGQASTWEDVSEKSRQALDEIGSLASVRFLPVPEDAGENLAVRSLALASGAVRAGASARYVAEVHNYGRRTREKVPVELLLDGRPVDQVVIDRLEPGRTRAVPLFVRFERAGAARLKAGLGRDALEMDNTRHAVAHVMETVRILCVDGDPSDRPFRGETDFLRLGFVPKPGTPAAESLAVEVVSYLELVPKKLADYDVVVLANVPDVHESKVAELARFVRGGGGLVLFLGDRVQAELLNRRLMGVEADLLPATLGDVASAPAEEAGGWPVAVADAAHPLAQGLRHLPAELLAEARVERRFRVEPVEAARPVLTVAGSSLPLVLERTVGRGKVVLVTTSADRDWTNLPAHPAFPILLHEAVTHLTRQPFEHPVTVGEPLVAPVPSQSKQVSVMFVGPDGRDFPVQVTQQEGGLRAAKHRRAEEPGFYEVRYEEAAPPLVLAVNVDPAESDARTLSALGLEAALAGLPAKVLAEEAQLAAAIKEGRIGRELWRTLMIAGLVVLALESLLAHVFTRRLVEADRESARRGREERVVAAEAIG